MVSSYWFLGAITAFSLFVEEKKRRGELAMYVLPKALESAWSIARRRAYVPFSKLFKGFLNGEREKLIILLALPCKVPQGEILLSSAALSMVMSTYQHEPSMLSGLVRTIVYQFVGLD